MVKDADLKGYKLFSGLDDGELAKIAGLCTRQCCESNTEIFTSNKAASDIFLLEGPNDAIRIELPIRAHGAKSVIHTLKKGEAFGWASLVPPHVRTATARCVEKADVICINGKALIEMLEENNHMGYIVMKNLSGLISSRLNDTTIALRHEIRNPARK